MKSWKGREIGADPQGLVTHPIEPIKMDVEIEGTLETKAETPFSTRIGATRVMEACLYFDTSARAHIRPHRHGRATQTSMRISQAKPVASPTTQVTRGQGNFDVKPRRATPYICDQDCLGKLIEETA